MLQCKVSFLTDIQPLYWVGSSFVLDFNQSSNLAWSLKRNSLHTGRGSASSFRQRRRSSKDSSTVHYKLAVKDINYFALSVVLLCSVLHVHSVMFINLRYEVKSCSSICVSCFPFLCSTSYFPLLCTLFVLFLMSLSTAYFYGLPQQVFP